MAGRPNSHGGNRDQLKRYWTIGEGRAKWSTWTELKDHLIKFMPLDEAKRTAAQWFHDTHGYWPGDQRGKNPVGHG